MAKIAEFRQHGDRAAEERAPVTGRGFRGRSARPLREGLRALGGLLILYGLSTVLRARRRIASKAGRVLGEAAGWAALIGGWALAATFADRGNRRRGQGETGRPELRFRLDPARERSSAAGSSEPIAASAGTRSPAAPAQVPTHLDGELLS